MSKKIHSQDSNSDIEWDMKALYDSFLDASDNYKKIIKELEDVSTECESEGQKITTMGS